jgi:hypothetical protein
MQQVGNTLKYRTQDQVRWQVERQAREHVENKVYWRRIREQVYARVEAHLEDQVSEQVREHVREHVRRHIWNHLKEAVYETVRLRDNGASPEARP